MSDQTSGGWTPPPEPPPRPGWGAPQPPSPGRKRRIGVAGWIGIGFGVFLVLGIIGTIAGSNDTATTPSPAATTSAPVTLDPAAVVRNYFAAINAKDYEQAWQLAGGMGRYLSFGAFVDAFKDVEHDEVTIRGGSANDIAITLVETAMDGTKTTYIGTYTVEHGHITSTSMNEVATTTTAAPATTKPKPAPAPAAEFGEGVYKVGVDIKPGLYKATVSSGMGYWARLRSEDTNDIITNDVKSSGTMYLRVHSSDRYVEIRGATFTKVG